MVGPARPGEVVALVGSDPARTAERAKVNGVAGAYTDLGEAIDKTGKKGKGVLKTIMKVVKKFRKNEKYK